MRSDLIDIDVVVHHETTKLKEGEDHGAWFVSTDVSTPKKIWIPKSMCEISERQPAPSKSAMMAISQAYAEEKGLI